MKNRTITAFLSLTLASALYAEAPDVTGALEYLFNPAAERWPGSDANSIAARRVTCLDNIDGRIYIGSGDWDKNMGPVPLYAINPDGARPTYTNEYNAGAEAIEAYKKFSDGRLWTRAVDPREHDAQYGFLFCKEPGGEWQKTTNIDWGPTHYLGNWYLYTHVWDFCEYKGRLYECGYGVGGGQDWLNADRELTGKMYDLVNNHTNDCVYYYYYSNATTNGQSVTYERNLTFLPFDNGLINVPENYYLSPRPSRNQPRIYRMDESAGRFNKETITWDELTPGLTLSTQKDQVNDFELQGTSFQGFCWVRNATQFKGRVLYILSGGISHTMPIAAFSATLSNDGKIQATKLVLDSGHAHLTDFDVVGDRLFALGLTYNPSDRTVTHTIWKSSDGLSFEKIASFTSDQFCTALSYARGYFYVGYAEANFGNSWANSTVTPAAEKAGQIWRFALPQEDVLEPANTAAPDTWVGNWVTDQIGATALIREGITGYGVRIGVVEAGCTVNTNQIVLLNTEALSADGHGTAVANIIGNRYYGVAPRAALKIYTRNATATQFEALVHQAVEEGVRILNCSFGWLPEAPEGMANYISPADAEIAYRAVKYAHDHGLLIIAGNGNMANNEAISIPAASPDALSVGGTTKAEDGSANLQNNWAHECLSFGIDVPVMSTSYTVTSNSGTSFAAPVVSGIAALVLQQNPNLTVDELKRIILDKCHRPDTSLVYPDRFVGMGYARAFRVGSSYVKQSQIDAERAAVIPMTSATLTNATWNAEQNWYELHFPSNTPTALVAKVEPSDTTDFVHWYVGNEDVVRPIDRDNLVCGTPVYKIDTFTVGGRTLVFTNNLNYGIITGRDASCTNVLLTAKVYFDQAPPTVNPGGGEGGEAGGEGGGAGDPKPDPEPEPEPEPEEDRPDWFTVDFSKASAEAWSNACNVKATWRGAWIAGFDAEAKRVSITDKEPFALRPARASRGGKDVTVLAEAQIVNGCIPQSVGDSGLASLAVIADEETGALSAYATVGSHVMALAGLPEGLVRGGFCTYGIVCDFESENAPRVKFQVNGVTMRAAADEAEWFALSSVSNLTEVSFEGVGLAGNFSGLYPTFVPTNAVERTFEEKMQGHLPVLSGYTTDGGGAKPAFAFQDDGMSCSIKDTVAGVYYTAFVSETLAGPFQAVDASVLSSGDPITFLANVTGKRSLFMLIVASETAYPKDAILEK